MHELYTKTIKIKSYEGVELLELQSCLQTLVFYLGIKESPTPLQMVQLTEFLQRNYFDLSIEQINLAFEMALSGKLELSENDLEHYQQFSALYLSKILNAYKAKQLTILKDISMRPKEVQVIQESFEEYFIRNKDYAIKAFETFKKDGDLKDLNNMVYKFLWRIKLINYPLKEVYPFQKQALKDWKAELSKAIVTASSIEMPILQKKLEQLQSKEVTKTDLKIIGAKARQLALIKYFKTCIDMDLTIEELINDCNNATPF